MTSSLGSLKIEKNRTHHFKLETRGKTQNRELQKKAVETYGKMLLKRRQKAGKTAAGFRSVQIEGDSKITFLKGSKVLFKKTIKTSELVEKSQEVEFHKRTKLFKGNDFQKISRKRVIPAKVYSLYSFCLGMLRSLFMRKGPTVFKQTLFEEALNLYPKIPVDKDNGYELNNHERLKFFHSVLKKNGKDLTGFKKMEKELKAGLSHFEKGCKSNLKIAVEKEKAAKNASSLANQIETTLDEIKFYERYANDPENRRDTLNQKALIREKQKLEKLKKRAISLEEKEEALIAAHQKNIEGVCGEIKNLENGQGKVLPLSSGPDNYPLFARVIFTGKDYELKILHPDQDEEGAFDEHKLKSLPFESYKGLTLGEVTSLFKANEKNVQIIPLNLRKKLFLAEKEEEADRFEAVKSSLSKKKEVLKLEETGGQAVIVEPGKTKALKTFVSMFAPPAESKRFKLNYYLAQVKEYHQVAKPHLSENDTHYLRLKGGVDKVYRLTYKLADENLLDETETNKILAGLKVIDRDLELAEAKRGRKQLNNLRKKLPDTFHDCKVRKGDFALKKIDLDSQRVDVENLKSNPSSPASSLSKLWSQKETLDILKKVRSHAEELRAAKKPSEEIAFLAKVMTSLPIPMQGEQDFYSNLSQSDIRDLSKELSVLNNQMMEAVYSESKPPSQFVYHGMLCSLAVCDRLCVLDKSAKYANFSLIQEGRIEYPWSEITDIKEKLQVEKLLDYFTFRSREPNVKEVPKLSEMSSLYVTPYDYFEMPFGALSGERIELDGCPLAAKYEYFNQFVDSITDTPTQYFSPSSKDKFHDQYYRNLPKVVERTNQLAHISTDLGDKNLLPKTFTATRIQLQYLFEIASLKKTEEADPLKERKMETWDGVSPLLRFKKRDAFSKYKNRLVNSLTDNAVSGDMTQQRSCFPAHQRKEVVFSKYANYTSENILYNLEKENLRYGNWSRSEVKERLIANASYETRIEDVLSFYTNNDRLMDPNMQEDLREVLFSSADEMAQDRPERLTLFKLLEHTESLELIDTFFSSQIDRYKGLNHPETVAFLYYLASHTKSHLREYCLDRGIEIFNDYLENHPESFFHKDLNRELLDYGKTLKGERDKASSLNILLSFANYDLYAIPFEQLSETQFEALVLGSFTKKIAKAPDEYAFPFLQNQLNDSYLLHLPKIQDRLKNDPKLVEKYAKMLSDQFNLEGELEKNPKYPFIKHGEYLLDFESGNIFRNGKAIALLPPSETAKSLFGSSFNPICELSFVSDPDEKGDKLQVFEFKHEGHSYRCVMGDEGEHTFQREIEKDGKKQWYQYFPGFTSSSKKAIPSEGFMGKISKKLNGFKKGLGKKSPRFFGSLFRAIDEAIERFSPKDEDRSPAILEGTSVWTSCDGKRKLLFLDKKLNPALEGLATKDYSLSKITDLRDGDTKGLTLLNPQKTNQKGWKLFNDFCGPDNYAVWGKKGTPEFIEVPNYGLRFKYDQKQKTWECLNQEYLGFKITDRQNMRAKGILPPSLVLENSEGKKKVLLSGRPIDTENAPFTSRSSLKKVLRMLFAGLILKALKKKYVARKLPKIFSLPFLDVLFRIPPYKAGEKGKLYAFDLSPDGEKMVSDKSKAKKDIASMAYLVTYYIYSHQFDLAATYMTELLSDSEYSKEDVDAIKDVISCLGLGESAKELKWATDPKYIGLKIHFLTKVATNHEITKFFSPEEQMRALFSTYFLYLQAEMKGRGVNYTPQSYQFLPHEEKSLMRTILEQIGKESLEGSDSLVDQEGEINLSAVLPLITMHLEKIKEGIEEDVKECAKKSENVEKQEAYLLKLIEADKAKKLAYQAEKGYTFGFLSDPDIPCLQEEIKKEKEEIQTLQNEVKEGKAILDQIGVFLSRIRSLSGKQTHKPLSKRKITYANPSKLAKKAGEVFSKSKGSLSPSERSLNELLETTFWKKKKGERQKVHRDPYVETVMRYYDLLADLEATNQEPPLPLKQLRDGEIPREERELVTFFKDLEKQLTRFPELLNPNLELSIFDSEADAENALHNYLEGAFPEEKKTEEKTKGVFRPLVSKDTLIRTFKVKDADTPQERKAVGKSIDKMLDELDAKASGDEASEELKNHSKQVGEITGRLRDGFKRFNEEEYDYKIATFVGSDADYKEMEKELNAALSKHHKWLAESEKELEILLNLTSPDSDLESIEKAKKGALKYTAPTFRELNLMLLKDQFHEISERNPALKTEHLKRVRELTFHRLFALRNFQSAQRALDNLKRAKAAPEREKGTFLKAALDEMTAKCHYDPRRQPVFLLIETEANISLWKKQIQSLTDQISDPTCVRQLIMGSGKTMVILPLIAHIRADGKRLSMLCTTRSLVNAMKTAVSHKNRDYFDQGCFFLQWERYRSEDLERKSSDLLTSLEAARINKKYVLTTREDIQALAASYKLVRDQLFEGGPDHDSNYKAFIALRKVFKLFKKAGVMTPDEVDKVLDPKEKTIFTLDQPLSFVQDELLRKQMQATFVVMKILCKNRKVGIEQNRQTNLLQEERKDVYRDCAAKLIDDNLDQLELSQEVIEVIQENKEAFVNYLTGQDVPQIEALVENSDFKEEIATVRGLFCSILETCLKSSNRMRYIRSSDGLHVIPCLEKDVPKEGSQFGHRLETLVYLIMNYKQEGVPLEIIRSLIQKGHIESMKQRDIEGMAYEEAASAQAFKKVFGISLSELGVNQEGVAPEKSVLRCAESVRTDMDRLLLFIENYILTEPLLYPKTIEVDAHEFVSVFHKCGGTSGSLNPNLLPKPINREGAVDLATNARTLYLMMRNNSRLAQVGDSAVVSLNTKEKSNDELNALTSQEDVKELLKELTGFDLIVDGGGIIRLSDEEVASLGPDLGFMMQYFNAKGFLDFKGGKELPKKVILGKNFSRGADVKLPSNAVSLNTFSENMTMEDLFQEVWRLRQMHKHQVAKILLTGWLLKHIGATEATSKEKAHDLILQYTILQQAIKDADDNLRSAKGALVQTFKGAVEAFAKDLSPEDEIKLMGDPKLFKDYTVLTSNLSSYREFCKINEKEAPVEQLIRLKESLVFDFKEKIQAAKDSFPQIGVLEEEVLQSLPKDCEIQAMASLFACEVTKNASAEQGTDVEVETQVELQVDLDVKEDPFVGLERDHHKKQIYYNSETLRSSPIIETLFGENNYRSSYGFMDKPIGIYQYEDDYLEKHPFIQPCSSIYEAFDKSLHYTQNWNPKDRVGSTKIHGAYQEGWYKEDYTGIYHTQNVRVEDLERYEPFDHPYQMPVHQVAYIRDVKRGELKVWILDKSDQQQIKSYIEQYKLLYPRKFEVCIKDLRSGLITASTVENPIRAEGASPITPYVLDKSRAIELEVQLKVMGGYLYFTQKEQESLADWLDGRTIEELESLNKLVFEKVLQYKEELRDSYPNSTLGKMIFTRLEALKEKVS